MNYTEIFLKPDFGNNKMERLFQISINAHKNISSGEIKNIPFWDENFFGLNKLEAWKNLSLEKKNNLLLKMSQHLLKEAYFIENAGMFYAAKMNLLAQTREERAFFSVMGFEETNHLYSLMPFFNSGIETEDAPSFSELIGKIVKEGDRSSNLFLIQILLEGWGLSYYQSLAESTNSRQLNEVFVQILKDESRHHSAGVLLHQGSFEKYNSFTKDSLVDLLKMVQIGPWTLVREINHAHGGNLTRNQLANIYKDLDSELLTNQKLAKLKSLTEKTMPKDFLNELEANKSFTSFNLDQMVMAQL